MRRTGIVLVVGVLSTAILQAQTAQVRRADSPWAAASGGEIPAGAVPYGNEADGREQFVCRGAYQGGTHLGKIAQGFGGCNIGYGGREITLPQYEVLVQQRMRHAEIAADALGAILEGRHRDGGQRGQQATSSAAPPAPSAAEPVRGFEQDGEPYVETRLPDGTIEHRTPSGGYRILPDGTRQTIRPMVFANAPIGTPPELPADPNRGRKWMESHNQRLLLMIQALVKNDPSEMKKFNEREQQANVTDLYEQIAYRTEVAGFLANGR